LPEATYEAVVAAVLGRSYKGHRNVAEGDVVKRPGASVAEEESRKLPKPKHPIEEVLPSIDIEEGEIYVTNGGLVLLNPFFQPCFEGLGWMQWGELDD
jgi:hypothetical protein